MTHFCENVVNKAIEIKHHIIYKSNMQQHANHLCNKRNKQISYIIDTQGKMQMEKSLRTN